jgi:serine/threonine-protein kinase
MDGGKYAEACPKLEESQRLDPGVGTLMYLGLCYEQVGKIASSWSAYRSAESAASNARQQERAKIAHERALALEPKLSKLTIRVAPGNADGIQVTRDGVALGQASWGAAVAVDPGKHTVTASAPGKKAWSTTVEVSSGSAEIALDVPRLEGVLAATATPVTGSAPASQGATGSHAPYATSTSGGSQTAIDQGTTSTSARGNTQRWVGVGVGAAGVIGIGVGAGFAAKSSSKSSDAENYRIAGTNVYKDPGYDLNQQALDAKKVATWSFIFGGAALAGGAVLYLTAPKARPSSARLMVHPVVGPSVAAFSFRGAW